MIVGHRLLVDEQGEILGHATALYNVDAHLLQSLGEVAKGVVAVQLAAEVEATGPREDARDGIRGRLLALLVLAIVAGHGAVCSFGLHGLAVGRHEGGCHQAEGSEALGHSIRLHVAIVVLARPDESPIPLHGRGDHVVDEAVLIRDSSGLELVLELGVEDLLENVLEAAVVGLEDGVLRREVQRPPLGQGLVHAAAGETVDALVRVVHAHGDTALALEVVDLPLGGLTTALRDEGHGQLALALDDGIGGLVLVSESVTANADRLRPTRHQARDVLHDDGLAEHGTTDDVAERTIGAAPHLLQAELLHTLLVRRDGRTLDADAVLLDRFCGVDRDLVVGLVALLDAEVVVEQLDVEVRQDESVLDELPDDAGHLIAVELDDGVVDLDLFHGQFGVGAHKGVRESTPDHRARSSRVLVTRPVGAGESSELAGAEVERAFDGGILIAVAAVNSIGSDALREVRTDGAGGSFGRVGGPDQRTEIGHCIVLFKDGGHDGATAHVLGELTEEGALAVHSVERLGVFEAELGPLHRLDGESSFDDAVEDLSSVAGAGGVGLDHGERAVGGHVLEG